MNLLFLLLLQATVLLVAGDTCDVDTSGSGGDLIDLHIIGFFPCTNPEDKREIPVDNCDGIDRIPIMRLALEEINERCDLLPGYRLVVDYANSGCSSIPAAYNLIQQTDPSQPTKLMILGTACSVATELMGEVAQRYMNLTQVAYTVSSSLFGKDKVRFPRFYRMVPITEQVADGYVALAENLGWKRITVLTDEDELNLNAGMYTEQKLSRQQQLLTRLTFVDDASEVLKEIEVLKRNLAGPDFVWFIPGWFRSSWWAAVDGTDCSAEEMKKSLEHTLGGLGNGILDYDPDRVLVSNKTVAQFKQDIDKKNELLDPVQTDIFLNVGYVYDTAWTIALALNASISTLEEKGLGRLEEYHSEWTEMSDVLTASAANVKFQGISGEVSFNNSSGNRKNPSTRIVQYRDGAAVPVLVYLPTDNTSTFIELQGNSLKWQGGYVPKDAPSPVIQRRRVVETVITTIAAVIGVLSTMFFLVFNIYHRKHPVVKRSSYRLNSVILSGILVGFIGTVLYTIEPDDNTDSVVAALVCNLRYWMTELASMVCFATFFVKIWRLYKLFFNEFLSSRKHLNDEYLLLAVGIMVAPALVLLIVQASIYPVTLHKQATINKDNLAEEEITFMCQGRHQLAFDTGLMIHRTILGLFSLKVAYETKKHLPTETKYRKYHESAVINLSTIVAIVPVFICEITAFLLWLNNIQTGLLLVITLRECIWMYPMSYLLFVPKVYRVYRAKIDPQYVTFRRFSRISHWSRYSSRSSSLCSRPSIWSIPRLSILSRRGSSDIPETGSFANGRFQYRSKSETTSIDTDIRSDSDDVFISESNSSDLPTSQQPENQRRWSQHRTNQHRSVHRRVTFTGVPPIPEQAEDDKDMEDCIVITNTVEVKIINKRNPDDSDPENYVSLAV